MVQKFDMKFLKDPKAIFPPPQAYYWIGHKGFAAEYPHAREVIASVYVPLADITAINGEVKDGKTMDQAIQGWTAKNTELLKRWENIKKD
jgi:glycine betaine/proline transport system substrate-binding protein